MEDIHETSVFCQSREIFVKLAAAIQDNISARELVGIALSKGRVSKPNDMVAMPQFGKPGEATDKLLTPCA